MLDQADGLRLLASCYRKHDQRMVRDLASRLVCVTGGKGGVGKTNVAANLGLALCSLGSRVVLFDADLGLANLDMILGLEPRYTLEHVVRGQVDDLRDVVMDGPGGLKVVAGGSGIAELANLPGAAVQRLLRGLMGLQELGDTVVIDTSAGIHQTVLSFIVSAHETLLVTTPEPTAVAAAYATMKAVSTQIQDPRFFLVVNMARSDQEGQEAIDRLTHVAKQFLGIRVRSLGIIPWDSRVSDAVRLRVPFVQQFPGCAASRRLRSVAEQLCTRKPQPQQGVGLATAVDRLRKFFFARA